MSDPYEVTDKHSFPIHEICRAVLSMLKRQLLLPTADSM